MYYIINRSALLMNFDTKKRLGFCLNTKKGENFFSFFSSEKAESLGAVEKLSPDELSRTTPTKVFLCGMRK